MIRSSGLRSCRCTPKQMATLRALHLRNTDGSLLDTRQVWERIGSQATLRAVRYTLEHLQTHGLVRHAGHEARRKDGARPAALWAITDRGIDLIRPAKLPSMDG